MPAQPQKKTKQNDPIRRDLKRLSRRVEQGFRSLQNGQKSLKIWLQRLEKRQTNVEKRQTSLEKRQADLEKSQQDLKKSQKSLLGRMNHVEAVMREIVDRQDRLEAKVDSYWEKTVELINQVYRVVEKEREENMKFRDQIYTIVDRISRYFTDFDIEKKALAARDDRIESRVGVLEVSEVRQNHTLQELDTRVAALEAHPKD